MTDTKLPLMARQNVVLFSAAEDGTSPKLRMEKRDSLIEGGEPFDVLVVEDLPVFRSGTFRDSMGYQHTWEGLHIDQMVQHFNLLRGRGILSDVPVRRDHPGFIRSNTDEVVGTHTTLKSAKLRNPVDGEEYDYLLATVEVSDPGAIEKISRGTWRNVSAEVGGWTSNNETEFWPVYQGVAYVDFSAVEGLKNFSNSNGAGERFSFMLNRQDKEAPVSGDTTTNSTGTPAPQAPAQPQLDPASFARANFTFTIGGQTTQDFAAVQAHITSLESAASEAMLANRKAFIKGLSEGDAPKILASAIDSIESFALKLDDDGWTAFTKSYESSPAIAAVSQHATGQVNQTGSTPVGKAAEAPTEIETAAAIVKQHRRGGMSPDKVKLTGSYQKLVKADPTHEALQGL